MCGCVPVTQKKGAFTRRRRYKGAGSIAREGGRALPRVCCWLITPRSSLQRHYPAPYAFLPTSSLLFSSRLRQTRYTRVMQFYPATGGAAMRPGLEYHGYPPNQRMNWPPALHPSAWNPYDYAAYSAAYPAAAGGGGAVSAAELRSPSAYHLTSPTCLSPQQQQQQGSSDQNGATRHNIADILGGQNLQSEIAKTGGYQKSPTSSTANMFSPSAASEHVRSPTTPTHPHGGMVYHHPGAGEVPANFYIPAALPRGLPGGHGRAATS